MEQNEQSCREKAITIDEAISKISELSLDR